MYTRNLARARRRRWEERMVLLLMRVATAGAAAILLAILAVIIYRGAGALSWEMLTQPPKGGFYLGGKGGILNAILGSVYLALGATVVAAFLAVPLVFFLHVYADKSRWAE